MIKKKKIFAFHLLNDRSGSPKVLRQVLIHMAESHNVNICTSMYLNGFLSNIDNVNYHNNRYLFKKNKWLRLVYLLFSQFYVMFIMYTKIQKNDLVYVNTVLPFGGALLGRIKGCEVIYHIHETTVNPSILKWILFKIVQNTASKIINVSKYVQQAHNISAVPNYLVYNAINQEFLDQVPTFIEKSKYPKNVLMICSLKEYKGVLEFIKLANLNQDLNFRLVLNASSLEVEGFFKQVRTTNNVQLFPSQENVHPFYEWADVVLNLSKPEGWVETFGLTIIEGMAYGLPAIVPPVGGILEVIEEGVTGYAVNANHVEEVSERLRRILHQDNYTSFSKASLKRIEQFKEDKLKLSISTIINNEK